MNKFLSLILLALIFACQPKSKPFNMIYSKADFDSTISGKQTSLYTLQNDNGMIVTLTNFGAKIVSIIVPDKEGNMADVVLGYKSIDEYANGNAGQGAIVGPYANRIANAQFELDGETYQLEVNNHKANLHSGANSFYMQVWDANPFESTEGTNQSNTKMEKVRQQMAKWREEVETANERIEELEAELKAAGEQKEAAIADAEDARRKLQLSQDECETLENRVADLEDRATKAEGRADQAEQARISAENQLAMADDADGDVADKLSAQRELAHAAEVKAEDLERKLRHAEEQNETLENQIEELSKVKDDHHAADMRAETAERKIQDLESQLEAMEEQLAAEKEEAEKAKNDLAETLRELGIE